MVISEKTKNEIAEIIQDEDPKSLYYYEYVFSILKKEFDYLNNLAVRYDLIDNNVGTFYDALRNSITINVGSNYRKARAYSKMLREDLPEDNELVPYLCVLILVHEIVHVEQSYLIDDETYPYKEIARMYDDVLFNSDRKKFERAYERFGEKFCFERNANIEAYKLILEIIPECFYRELCIQYILYMFSGYDYKYKLATPTRYTYKKLNMKYDIKTDDIPLMTRIIHGLDLTKEEYMYYIGYFKNQKVLKLSEMKERYER